MQAAFVYVRGEISLRDGRVVRVTVPLEGKIIRGGTLLLKLIASIQLFRLRRAATRCFVAALGVSVVISTHDAPLAVLNSKHPVLIVVAIILNLLLIAVCASYSLRLANRGFLSDT